MAEKKAQLNKVKNEFDLSVEVANRIELENVRQLAGNFKLEQMNPEGEKTFTIIPKPEVIFDDENNKILVFIDFVVETFVKKGKEEKTLGTIGSNYLLIYNLKSAKDLTQKHFRAFAKFNGVFNAWPYLREFTQMATSRLSLPPLVLPTYRYGMELMQTPEKRKIKKKVKNKKSKRKT